MPKKKTRVKQQVTPKKQTSNNTFLQITPEELQNIIANALLQAEEQRKQNEKDKLEQERQKWREEIGYKDYSKSKSIFAEFLSGLNGLICGLKLLFMPSKKIRGHKMISTSLNMELSNNYLFVGLTYLIFSLFIVAGTVTLLVLNLIPWYIGLLLFIFSICLFLFALRNRLAYYEATYIKDDNFILNILASHNSKISIVISFISATIAIIALLKDVIYELF
ncbi:MAG: hypothetical protein K2O44_00720 [Clostridia bacterium]|nr:hypothetical protein [Clostridia bacterium]